MQLNSPAGGGVKRPNRIDELKRLVRSVHSNLINRWRIFHFSRQALRQCPAAGNGKPTIAFFRASSGILQMNLNNAFHLLSAWALRLQGARVVHFVCQRGMSRCILGTNRNNPATPPPCAACMRNSRGMYIRQERDTFTYRENTALASVLCGLDLNALFAFKHEGLALGQLVQPALRWILRRHHLQDNEPTRFLMREYILSAAHVAQEFSRFLDQYKPEVIVLFNGSFYPEAIARQIALSRGLRVITHEVGLQAMSAYFTDGEATAYPITIPSDFELSNEQNARLDAYLEKRFQGNFSMAGIRFWPEMRGLDDDLLSQLAKFKQMVPVFTNVIFDTSQAHANTVFPHMFAWLDKTLEIIKAHSETLFIIRAHPDEKRTGKESRESVEEWAERNRIFQLPNALFIPPDEYISSYALIQRAQFVMVYNSSIGLEATLLGAAVISGGKARYTPYPTVFFPQSIPAFEEQVEAFLAADQIEVPPEFQRNARRFLYYQLFKTSLPFDEFLQDSTLPGFVNLRPISWKQLTPEHSPTIRVIVNGILQGKPFLLD
ncbi:MAG: hypothetical protein JW726_01425 [Anaerolineales bacterium]|nr:hypothetical protein [Anaerolineales bacterium]